jgi:hypothetical protein
VKQLKLTVRCRHPLRYYQNSQWINRSQMNHRRMPPGRLLQVLLVFSDELRD